MNEQKEALEELYNYLPKLHGGILEASRFFSIGAIGSANELLIQIIDGINWSLEVIKLTREVQVEELETTQLIEIVLELVGAMENSDHVLTSDLLQYEIAPIIEEWHGQLERSMEIH